MAGGGTYIRFYWPPRDNLATTPYLSTPKSVKYNFMRSSPPVDQRHTSQLAIPGLCQQIARLVLHAVQSQQHSITIDLSSETSAVTAFGRLQ